MGSPNNIPRWNGFYANSRIPLYVRKGDWWSPSLSRFSLNRPTASLKKGSSPFRGENFRCYSTCFSSNRARQRRDLYSVARSLEDDCTSCRFSRFVTSINIHTSLLSSFSLDDELGQQSKRTMSAKLENTRSGGHRQADSSECKYRPNNRTPSLLLKKEEGDHPGRSPIGPGLDQVHLVFKKKRRNFPLSIPSRLISSLLPGSRS